MQNRQGNVLRSSNDTTIVMNCLSSRNNVVDIQQDIVFASLPFLEITSPPTSIDQLASSDVDLHLPYDMSFQYYNSHKFQDNRYISEYFSDKYFSALHCNIRSLSANFDNLQHVLSELDLLFSTVGLIEIKLKSDQSFLLNIENARLFIHFSTQSFKCWRGWFLH